VHEDEKEGIFRTRTEEIYFGRWQFLNSLFSFLVRASVPLEDKKFMKYVQDYAKDASKFNTDFTAAFVKLEELGTSNLTPVEWA
jgi:hypothetical protein